MKTLVLLAPALLVSAGVLADGRGGDRRGSDASITVAISGLACSTTAGPGTFAARSWSWGATNSGSNSGSGSGVGRTLVGDLNLKKSIDGCSPALFGALAAGRRYATLTLTQRDSDGNTIATVALDDAILTAWTVGSGVRESSAEESLVVTFRRVCITTSGAASLCYDAVRGTLG